MEIKNIVTTEEQSKRLDELWFKKESCFSYYRNWEIHPTLEWPYCLYPAYTASELMEYFPEQIEDAWVIFDLCFMKTPWYSIFYNSEEFWICDWEQWNENLTHALAEMLIYLLENNLINNDLCNCIECWEPVWHHEAVKNCHSHCRLEL